MEHKKRHIMKKKLFLALIIMAVSSNLAFSQVGYQQVTDGFFSKNTQEGGMTNERGTFEMFSSAGSTKGAVAVRAPIGSGLLLLAGMGLTYGVIRRKVNG